MINITSMSILCQLQRHKAIRPLADSVLGLLRWRQFRSTKIAKRHKLTMSVPDCTVCTRFLEKLRNSSTLAIPEDFMSRLFVRFYEGPDDRLPFSLHGPLSQHPMARLANASCPEQQLRRLAESHRTSILLLKLSRTVAGIRKI